MCNYGKTAGQLGNSRFSSIKAGRLGKNLGNNPLSVAFRAETEDWHCKREATGSVSFVVVVVVVVVGFVAAVSPYKTNARARTGSG